MNLSDSFYCINCHSTKFLAKQLATYIYSYKIDTKSLDNELSFEFDNRERGNSSQYLECENCGAIYPCDFNLNPDEFDFTIMQQAIRTDYTTKPELSE